MFRCYLLNNGHIVWGQDLAASTIADAVASSQDLRAVLSTNDEPLATEIWQGTALLYYDACDTPLTRHSAPIVSLFNTVPGAMYCTWEPARDRSPMNQANLGFRHGGSSPATHDRRKR